MLQIVQGRRRIGAFGQREVDQCGLASHRRTILQLSGQIAPGGCDALLALHQSGQRQHRRDAAIVLAHLGQERTRTRQVAHLLVPGQQAGQYLGQVIGIVAGRPLERTDRRFGIARIGFDPAFDDAGADAASIGLVGARYRGARRFDVVGGTLAFGKLALELGDQLAHGLAGDFLIAQRVVDRLFPIALGLVDADQVLECLRRPLVDTRQISEHGLRPVQQARAHVVLAQCQQGLHALGITQVRALHQALMQADRAIHLTPPPEQMA